MRVGASYPQRVETRRCDLPTRATGYGCFRRNHRQKSKVGSFQIHVGRNKNHHYPPLATKANYLRKNETFPHKKIENTTKRHRCEGRDLNPRADGEVTRISPSFSVFIRCYNSKSVFPL